MKENFTIEFEVRVYHEDIPMSVNLRQGIQSSESLATTRHFGHNFDVLTVHKTQFLTNFRLKCLKIYIYLKNF